MFFDRNILLPEKNSMFSLSGGGFDVRGQGKDGCKGNGSWKRKWVYSLQ